MPATVFASTGGRKYHFDKACKAFESAQMLSDMDCGCDTYCTHRLPVMHGLVRMSSTKAAMDGKLPCLVCVPAHLRELPEAETFGHEPASNDVDYWGETNDDLPVCARCTRTVRAWLPEVIGQHPDGRVITAEDRRVSFEVAVLWPCTSAIVLGLVPRPAE
jgi:hypothetical protein